MAKVIATYASEPKQHRYRVEYRYRAESTWTRSHWTYRTKLAARLNAYDWVRTYRYHEARVIDTWTDD